LGRNLISNLTIRYVTPADDALLANLGARTFNEAYAQDIPAETMAEYLPKAFNPKVQAEEINEIGSTFLIVEIGEEAVGYARLQEGHAPTAIEGSHPIELVRIYLVQEATGSGVGSKLMQACLDEAKIKECDRIWLGVWERNTRAIAFYLKWGFVIVSSQEFEIGGELHTDLVMQRPVQGGNTGILETG
jgi:ribosomal protein S18 acetylase RimI-like enzyme